MNVDQIYLCLSSTLEMLHGRAGDNENEEKEDGESDILIEVTGIHF